VAVGRQGLAGRLVGGQEDPARRFARSHISCHEPNPPRLL
jgi:hypothetical protein